MCILLADVLADVCCRRKEISFSVVSVHSPFKSEGSCYLIKKGTSEGNKVGTSLRIVGVTDK